MKKLALFLAIMLFSCVYAKSSGLVPLTLGGYFGSPLSDTKTDKTYLTPRDAVNTSGINFHYFIVYIEFNAIELDTNSVAMRNIRRHVTDVINVGGTPIIICNPVQNDVQTLTKVSSGELDASMIKFATMLKQFSCNVLISFGPEMNGPWCKWGQQAAAYKPAFIRASQVLRTANPKIKMCWVPNWAKGYPWNSSDLNLSGAYSDYFPGDAYIDYVGMNIYYKDWEEKDYVPNWFWETSLEYLDFYAIYTTKHPMIITETSGVDFSKSSVDDKIRVPLSEAEMKAFKTEYLVAIRNIVRHHSKLEIVCFFNIIKNEYASDSSHDFGMIDIDFRMPFDVLDSLIKYETDVPTEINPMLTAYPNPCTDYLSITSPSTNYQARITDIFGEIVWSKTLTERSTIIDMSKFSAGIYFYKSTTTNSTNIIKIIRQ